MLRKKLSAKFLRTSFLVLMLSLTLVSLVGADPLEFQHDPGVVTDDPYDEDAPIGFDGSGYSYVEANLGSQAPAHRADRKARNISLVGAYQGAEFNQGVFADVAGYKNLAFLGRWRGACPGTGVDIIDISKPKAPVKIADTNDYADTSMEDMEAISINGRDILGVGLQDCGNVAGVGTVGMELYDITNPAAPVLLSLFNGVNFGQPATRGSVHELDLVTIPDGRTLALLASPDLEANTNPNGVGGDGIGDLLIVDISNPSSPTLIGEWGVLDEPALGLSFYLNVRQGGDGRTLLHGARANVDGTRAYLSYWDAGFITLDISNPSSPVFLGTAPTSAPGDSYAAGQEGNAHSVDEARGGNILVAADEDFSPFAFVITSSAFTGQRSAVEAAFTSTRIGTLPAGLLTGNVVHVGRGCPANSIFAGSPADAYLASPAGNIALIERGACAFAQKIGRAQQAGATGVIMYNSVAGGEALVSMGGTDPVTMTDGSGVVDITFAAAFVQRSTGLLMAGAGTPSASVGGVFNGWGYLRIFDMSDPANPVQVGSFATANTNNPAVANSGTWSVHNPEVRGNTVYTSWYSDGVRVIDISQPSAPREIGFWTGLGAPFGAPAVNIWSVVPHGNLLLVSDRNFGLYILVLKP